MRATRSHHVPWRRRIRNIALSVVAAYILSFCGFVVTAFPAPSFDPDHDRMVIFSFNPDVQELAITFYSPLIPCTGKKTFYPNHAEIRAINHFREWAASIGEPEPISEADPQE